MTSFISQLESYTYFETKSGLICYSYGPDARYNNDSMVCSVVGYFSQRPTNRTQIATGRYVEKFVYEGNEGDLDATEQFQGAPESVRRLVKGLVRTNPETNERLLVVPLSEISKAYSPQVALASLLSGASGLGIQKEVAVRKLVNMFNSFGIDQNDLGLYGSLAYGVLFEPYSDSIDIDIVVFGLKYRSKIKDIVAKYGTTERSSSKYSEINNFLPWNIARECRRLGSHIWIDGNIRVDIRMVRRKEDPVSFDFQKQETEPGDIDIEGIVVDDTEGLTYPTVYKVESGDMVYTIGTRLYVFTGAAKKGDRVKVRGKKLIGRISILIADARKHFILPSKES